MGQYLHERSLKQPSGWKSRYPEEFSLLGWLLGSFLISRTRPISAYPE